MCSKCGCGCPDSAKCNCASFSTGKGYVNSFSESYTASEMNKNSATSGRVPVGKRNGRPVGKR